MTHKHTPAPWYYDDIIDQVESFEEDGNRSLQVKIDCHSDNKLANTHLIAAAPELLKALEIAQRYVPKISGSGYIIIKEAIKKARGQK